MPKLRDAFATQKEANRLAGYVKEWLDTTDPTTLFQTCFTCNKIDREPGAKPFCFRYKVAPPVAVISGHTNCPGYEDQEEIPF